MCRRAHLLSLCLLLSSPISLIAQSTNATIAGTVNDSAHHLIANADIQIVSDATGLHYSTTTNRDGIYNISALPPGPYRVQASAIGFKTIVTPNVVLNVQGAVALNFVLPVGATSETLTVEAGTTLLNTIDASVSTVVDQKFIANMPLNGRSLQSLIELAPGVVKTPIPYGSGAGNSGEFSVNGQRTESNYYMLDGVSVNVGASTNSTATGGSSGLLPNQTALGTTQNLASLDALQEFRINTSTYSAEYGRTSGGQISLQTKSGTNAFHGDIFDYFRNDALDANNWFNNHTTPQTPKTAERQNDFGGTVGGPILIPHIFNGRDKTFFFYSYEGLRLRVPTPATTIQVPDIALRQQAASALQSVVNAFPIPNGGEVSGTTGLAYFTGAYSLPSNLDTQSIRFDHAINHSNHLFGHFSDSTSDSSVRSSYNLAQRTQTSFISRSLTSGLTTVITHAAVNDIRYNYTWTSTRSLALIDDLGGSQPATFSTFLSSSVPTYSAVGLFLYWGSAPRVTPTSSDIGQTSVNIVDTFDWQFRQHNIKIGADYRRLELTNAINQFNASVLYTSPSQVINNTSGTVTVITAGTTPALPLFHNISLFAQDEWSLSSRLHLSLGARWDVNPPPTNAGGPLPATLSQISNLATAAVAPTGKPLWNTDYRGIAPRLGLSYQMNSEQGRETVVRAGFGSFYDAGNTLGALGFTLLGLGSRASYVGLSLPLPASVYVLPTPSTAAPYGNSVAAFDPNLRLPRTYQWNVSLEQALGTARTFTVGYVASSGVRLLQAQYFNPATINPAFSKGFGLYTVRNGSWSNYSSLQAQFKQRITSGLQALVSMTWAHSIDNLSTGYINYQPLLKGDSDFDIRTNLQGAVTYNIPNVMRGGPLAALINSWGVDLRAFARSAAPVDIYGSLYVAGDGTQQYSRPNIIPNTPLYVYGSRTDIPGGKKINYNAFQAAGSSVGNAPRNFVRGFGASEIDAALRREFPLTETSTLQFRAEAFNLLNRPVFGAIYNTMTVGSSQFGQAYNTLNVGLKDQSALYEQGGPRSLQLAIKILF